MNNTGQITLSRKEMGTVEGGMGEPATVLAVAFCLGSMTYQFVKGWQGEMDNTMCSAAGKNMGLAWNRPRKPVKPYTQAEIRNIHFSPFPAGGK